MACKFVLFVEIKQTLLAAEWVHILLFEHESIPVNWTISTLHLLGDFPLRHLLDCEIFFYVSNIFFENELILKNKGGWGLRSVEVSLKFHLYLMSCHIRAWLIIEKYQTINQVTRAKLYNSCLLFGFRIFFIITWYHVLLSLSYFSSHTFLFGPTYTYGSIPSLLLTWESISLLFSLLHISKNAD
jgi:hypothetical protein